jgi:hypothetical protein
MVAEQLQSQGVRIYEPSYDFDHNLNPIFRKICKMFITICFCINHHKEYKALQHLAKKNGYISLKNNIKQLVNIIPKIKYYQKSETSVYIWDEGLVQSAISLTLKSRINARKVEKDLISIVGQKKIIKVHIRTDIKTALHRMTKRSSNDSRVEQEHDERKKQAIMIWFEESCNQIDGDIIQVECSNLPAEILSKSISNQLMELI